MPTALITGTTSGIGNELAKIFAKNGYDLICVARNKEKLMSDAATLTNEYKITVDFLAVDLATQSAAQEIISAVNNLGRKIDVLVNNAGAGVWGEFTDTNINDELNIINLNIVTPTILMKHYVTEMSERNGGKILNTASIAGFAPGPLMSVYHATKAYLLSLTEAVSEELEDTNVTITALCPGPTKTEFDERAGAEGVRGFQIDFLLMEPHEVAQYGYDGLMANKRIVIPGLKNQFNRQIERLIPRSWLNSLFEKVYEKPGQS